MDGMDPEYGKGLEEEDVVMTVLDGVIGLVGCKGLAGWKGLTGAVLVVLVVHGKDDIITESPVKVPL